MGPLLETDLAEIDQAVAVNVRGPLAFVRALAPGMCERGRGGVVLMSSLAGLQGVPGITTYAATKAFNINLGEGLWGELGERGIDVSVCCSECRANARLRPIFGAEGTRHAVRRGRGSSKSWMRLAAGRGSFRV